MVSNDESTRKIQNYKNIRNFGLVIIILGVLILLANVLGILVVGIGIVLALWGNQKIIELEKGGNLNPINQYSQTDEEDFNTSGQKQNLSLEKVDKKSLVPFNRKRGSTQALEVSNIANNQLKIWSVVECAGEKIESSNCDGPVSFVCHTCFRPLCEKHAHIFPDSKFPFFRETKEKGYFMKNQNLITGGIILVILGILMTLANPLLIVLVLVGLGLIYAGNQGKFVLEQIGNYIKVDSTKYNVKVSTYYKIIGYYYTVSCWTCFPNNSPHLFSNAQEIASNANPIYADDYLENIKAPFLSKIYSVDSQINIDNPEENLANLPIFPAGGDEYSLWNYFDNLKNAAVSEYSLNQESEKRRIMAEAKKNSK